MRRALVAALALALAFAACAAAAAGALDAVGRIDELIDAMPSAQRVLETHALRTHNASLAPLQEVLAFVTPWNARGYEFAEQYANKLTHVSPVWLRVEAGQLAGMHDIDAGWMQRVRAAGAAAGGAVQIVPRLSFDFRTGAEIARFFDDRKLWRALLTQLMQLVREHGFDGFVLDLHGVGPHMHAAFYDFVKSVSRTLHGAHKSVLYAAVAPQFNGQPMPFTREVFVELAPLVDRICLGAYDFSMDKVGPVAPMDWIVALLDHFGADDGGSASPDAPARKLLLGLNFYGYDYAKTTPPSAPRAITANDYLRIIEEHQPTIACDQQRSQECAFEYHEAAAPASAPLSARNKRLARSARRTVQHVVFFPHLASIHARLSVVRARGLAGVAIWEIGQGLANFFDLL